MTELFQANFNIIKQRWPEAAEILQHQQIENIDAALVSGANQTISVNGIQLSSRHNRLAETQLFLSTLPASATQATMYGFGMGDVPYIALDEARLSKLTICILNPAIFALVLSYTDHTPWLQHPGVELDLQPSQMQLKTPYIAITPDLELVSDDNARLRDLLQYELNREHANRRHRADDPAIIERFEANKEAFEQDPDVMALTSRFTQDKAIVIASGPSLEEHYEKLAEISIRSQHPIIVAVDTALHGLLHHGIKPDIVVAIDGLISEYHLPLQQTAGISLVYQPRLRPEIIQQWQGPRYNALGHSHLYDKQAEKYPEKTRLYTNGSVLHPAVDLAIKLGCKEITLCGADFCFCNNKSHAFWQDFAATSSDEQTKAWATNLQKSVNESGHWVVNGVGEKVATSLNLCAYLRNLENYISKVSHVKFYRSSLAGADILGTQFKEL
ncbi:motility associated factor glycosyltransferase family protein [Shewanella dokdonensis]|uniref:DUF115 domain-containing protein n=1 Tax=Shewanella dokdonensis TaxID=712036 RepID=A0ABX8DIV1_9GAMM|nr:6-hydroxymethylpterin diphosphokinase MptE-like protein [Shewanella dokdonensis]MCL1073978.1 DUF115 domain-containing protein [Shewanella dokdonensis]QVK23737.1 DUF115 domain-containing protein [Shewanella dokdonensis]